MQCGPDLRAKLFALNQGRGEGLDVIDGSPLRQTSHRLTKARARGDFRRDEAQFGADFLLLSLGLGADDLDRLIETESGLDAYDQQVEHVRELLCDRALALLGAAADVVARQEHAESHPRDGEHDDAAAFDTHYQRNNKCSHCESDGAEHAKDLESLCRTGLDEAGLREGLRELL